MSPGSNNTHYRLQRIVRMELNELEIIAGSAAPGDDTKMKSAEASWMLRSEAETMVEQLEKLTMGGDETEDVTMEDV